jgi:hypothetical protein
MLKKFSTSSQQHGCPLRTGRDILMDTTMQEKLPGLLSSRPETFKQPKACLVKFNQQR